MFELWDFFEVEFVFDMEVLFGLKDLLVVVVFEGRKLMFGLMDLKVGYMEIMSFGLRGLIDFVMGFDFEVL